MLRCFYFRTTFMRDLRPLLQIRQFARLRSATCSLQGLSSTQRSARATPSRDLTLGAMQLATVMSPEPAAQAREPLQTIIP